MLRFSLVTTVFNEAKRLSQTIKDIEDQSVKPDELVIVDAGSKDGTVEILEEWSRSSEIPIKVIIERGCNVARGRNIAISHAFHDLIVSTDFGCRFHPCWLQSITEPFIDPAMEVVGGSFTVRPDEMDTLAGKADYILQKGYPVVMDQNFSVSSRSIAYKKYVWERLKGYPEWLTLAADDTIFWRLIKKGGFKYRLVDKPYVYWMRHKTFTGFAKEDFRYGLGDGEGRINQRNVISKVLETLLRYSLFLNIILLPFTLSYSPWPFVCLLCQLPGLRSYVRAFGNWLLVKKYGIGFSAFLASLYLTEVVRINYIKGYSKGYFSKNRMQVQEAKILQERLA